MNPNQFMHQNQILDGLGRSSILNLILMHKPIRIHGVTHGRICSTLYHKVYNALITVRNSSCGKVMCSQTSVKNSVHRGPCVARGGMCGEGEGHAWQRVGRCEWQERRPLRRTVSILLECILVNYVLTVSRVICTISSATSMLLSPYV